MEVVLVRQFPVGPGGAEAYAALLAAGLASRCRVRFVCANAPAGWSPAPGVEVVRLDPSESTRTRSRRPLGFGDLWLAWRANDPRGISLSLDRNPHVDILRTGDGLHADWLDIRALNRSWVSNLAMAFDPFHRAMLRAEVRAYDQAGTHRVLANSRFLADAVARRYGFPRERIRVIANPVDTARWTPGPAAGVRADHGIGRDGLLAIFVGSGWERKGLAEAARAVEAWAEKYQRPARLVVAGRDEAGAPRSDVIKLCGDMRGDALLALYRAADALLLPTRYDPFANVTLEALACGCPVLTTPFNGGADALAGAGTGAVLRLEQGPVAWADELERLRVDRDPDACRRAAEACSADRHMRAVIALLEEVAQERGES